MKLQNFTRIKTGFKFSHVFFLNFDQIFSKIIKKKRYVNLEQLEPKITFFFHFQFFWHFN